MKTKILILLLLFISLGINGYAQDPQSHFILDNHIDASLKRDYLASDYVQMINGFSAAPYPSTDLFVHAKTDPLLVFPPEDGDITGGSTNNNEGGVVGTLPGNLSVSPSGAAVYSIPIEVPPGVNGMTPSLGLVYNSQGGNGLLGVGWSLSGLSAITRTGTTLYHQGYIDGVDFDDNDQYMLDGQRLIPVNSDNTEFRTEIETFSKIVISESNDFGPVSFEVYTKDGRILEYGNGGESRVYATKPGLWSILPNVLNWNISKITDRNGNYIEYSYYGQIGGIAKIKSISYGANSNTGQNHIYTIRFNYNDLRQDNINSYSSIKSVVSLSYLLDNIEIENIDGETIKKYQLNYSLDHFTHLEDITMIDIDNNIINPTKFEWGNKNPERIDKIPFGDNHEWDQFFIDFTGDGKTDLIEAHWELYNNSKKYDNWHYRIGYGTSFGTAISFQNTPFDFFGYFLFGDFNGDGYQDLASVSYTHEAHDVMFIDYVFLSNGNTFTQIPVSFNSINADKSPVLVTGDFDGNGIDEILLAHRNNMGSGAPNLYIYQFNESNQTLDEIFSHYCGFQGINDSHEVFLTGNFIKNGKMDVVYTMNENGTDPKSFIIELDITNQSLTEIENFSISTEHRVFVGDFNGDGVTDFLTRNNVLTGLGWNVSFLDNVSTMDPPPIPNFDPLHDVDAYVNGINIADYNGDGLSDIIVFHKYDIADEFAEYTIYISNGNTFEELTTNEIYCSLGLDFHGGSYPIKNCRFKFQIDFNGDGHADFYKYNGDKDDHMYLLNIDYNYNQLLTITNGLGSTSSISYKPITDNSIYTKGNSSVYPILDIQNPIYVASSISNDNGIGGNSVVKYYYKEAKVCVNGKGFLGFGKITNVFNYGTFKTTKVENYFKTNTEYYFNWLEKTCTYAKLPPNTPLELLSKTENKPPVINDLGDKRFFYYTPKSITNNLHTGDNNSSYVNTTLTIQNFSSDDIEYGNITSIDIYTDPDELSFDSPIDDYDFYNKSSFTYYNYPDIWLLGLVQSKSTKSWTSEDSDIDNHLFQYSYYTDSPLLEIVTTTPNGCVPLTTKQQFSYDDYGNTTVSRIFAPYYTPAIPDKYTYYTYNSDYYHRFVTETKKILDGVDYITTKTYYNSTGLPHTSTDLLGNTTTYYYDGFGRITQTDFPDGTQARHRLFWAQNHEDNPANGLYYTWSQSSGNPEVLIFKDKLGRELRSVSRDITNSKVFSDIEYNAFGQVKKESNSHYTAGNILWTEYEYLATGKVKKIISPTSEATFDYLGRITNTTTQSIGSTNETIVTTQEVNAIGQTIKMTDAGGTIDYSYYGSGNIKNITTGGNITTMSYDEAGRQEQLIDPSAGTSSFVYNAFGELISQTDANNNTYKLEYDGFGRISKKYLVGDENDIIDYEYYLTPENGFGQLKWISMPTGIKTEFEYDNFGRTIKKTKTIDETDYEFTYEYNVFGKSKKQTWPSGFAVDYRYKNGYLSTVKESLTEKTLWELTDINAQGQIKQYQLGNGLLTTKEFDTYGLPVSITTSNNVQENEYHFNTFTGNLEWRSTTLSPAYGGQYLREDFTYDDDVLKNRLETWTVQGGTTYSNTYLNSGNIDTKTGIGTYDYSGTSGPFAVDKITNPETTYLSKVEENDHHINYTGFNKVNQLWASVDDDDPLTLIEFTYGPNRQRCKTELYNEGTFVKSKLYIGGDYEIETEWTRKYPQTTLHWRRAMVYLPYLKLKTQMKEH